MNQLFRSLGFYFKEGGNLLASMIGYSVGPLSRSMRQSMQAHTRLAVRRDVLGMFWVALNAMYRRPSVFLSPTSQGLQYSWDAANYSSPTPVDRTDPDGYLFHYTVNMMFTCSILDPLKFIVSTSSSRSYRMFALEPLRSSDSLHSIIPRKLRRRYHQ